MAQRISIKSPMRRDETDGFWAATTTSLETARANLRNLLLTAPGERLFHPDFGLNPRRMLFENFFDQDAYKDRVHAQVSKHLPYLTIDDVLISTADDDPAISVHHVRIKMFFHLRDYESLHDSIEHTFER